MLRSVKVITKYSSWTTSVNGLLSDREIEDYFVGKDFDVGVYPAVKFETVIQVEISS